MLIAWGQRMVEAAVVAKWSSSQTGDDRPNAVTLDTIVSSQVPKLGMVTKSGVAGQLCKRTKSSPLNPASPYGNVRDVLLETTGFRLWGCCWLCSN